MTGPLAPVGILNPIRASLGIPPDSTFPENALGAISEHVGGANRFTAAPPAGTIRIVVGPKP
jgi:hypothetical protein